MDNIIAWIGENWVNILVWSTEFLAVLFCIHGVFGEKFKVNLCNVVLTLMDILMLAMIYEKILHEWISCFIYVAIFVYCFKIFKMKMIRTICYFILSFIVVGAVQIVATYIIIPVEGLIEWRELLMLLLNSISLIISFLLLKVIPMGKERIWFRIRDNKLVIIIIVCGLSILFMLLDYHYRREMDQIYYFVFMALVLGVCFYWTKMQKVQFELEKKNLELELQEVYGAAYKEMIFEVRRKQHDFMNQLGAIYSMHVTALSLEDLIKKQREYGAVLMTQDRYDKILTGCNNPILAGYLYYKCVGFGKSNITVEYKIHVDTAECKLSLHEVIEILGILLTNAFESMDEAITERKLIVLGVEETCENLCIEVSNLSKYLTGGEIDKIFNKGFSSKGKNRGIGLARVKQLVEKSGSDIIVENYVRAEENWIRFKVVIPK